MCTQTSSDSPFCPTERPELAAARALDHELVAARKAERGAQHRLATLLAEMADTGFFRILGYTSVEQYAELVLELSFRAARDLLRIGRCLGDLPTLTAALADGDVDWTKAREIVRVATPDTDSEWTERAKFATARQIEHEVSFARAGDSPPKSEPESPRKPARRRVTFEMEASEAEMLFAALAVVRKQMGVSATEVEDGAILGALAQRAIHDAEPSETPTGERYRTMLYECAKCHEKHNPHAEISETVAAESACDVEIVDVHEGGHVTRAIAPVLRRKLMQRASHRCEVPGCTSKLWLDVHHLDGWARTKTHAPDRLVVLCSGHHRGIHGGNLAVDVGAELRVRVEHADGRSRVGPVRESLGRSGERTRHDAPS